MGEQDKRDAVSKVVVQKRPAEHSLEQPRANKKSNTGVVNTTTSLVPVADQTSSQPKYFLRPRNKENKQLLDNKENVKQPKPHKTTVNEEQATPTLKGENLAQQKVVESSPVPDVDTGGNPWYVPEYAQNIFTVYRDLETKYLPDPKYMNQQPFLKPGFRAILVDWLVDVHFKFKMMPETIFLTVNLIDRFLSKCKVQKQFLQLIGCSALLIASKYEEIWAPKVSELVQLCDGLYKKQQILQMEKKILKCLDYEVTVPTAYHFLLRYLKIAGLLSSRKDIAHLAFYFTELAMVEYDMIKYSPSLISVASIYVAMKVMKIRDCYPYELRKHSNYSLQNLKECAIDLLKLQAKTTQFDPQGGPLSAVFNKYSNKKMLQVTAITVPPEILKQLESDNL